MIFQLCSKDNFILQS